ncbi:hypothetical protein CPB84DRAFT_1763375 [Gymnopilus junonius]|uniref:B30.2/SPRY domain-containing protein n=1 Tax=Gymnopilus junonius TaxID=109634 RepID=A0A9P5P051_GYMJU|nr:hypothetical protein CPB84DRAFT_1763375 [Gymnopilus junonius]
MHAEGSSPPPPESILTGGLGAGTLLQNAATTTSAQSRNKRKRPAGTAASPAPSDVNSNPGNGTNPTDLLVTSRADLSSRPILTISRGPVFVPVAEGSEWFKTEMIGVNRIGYRYIPAGINPPGHAAPCRTIESNPTSFRVSWEDRSPLIKVTKDGLSLAGFKGFRSARCNAPMREGKWYMEVKVLHGGGEPTSEDSRGDGAHVRLGWGRRESPLNAPVGLDGYSYGYRDKTGDKVTLSRPRPYGRPFGTGDVIGMYISLPPRRQPNKKDPHDPAHLKRERIPIDLKGQEVFEILEYPQSKEMTTLMDYSGKTTSSASVPSSNKKAVNGKLPDRSGPSVPSNKTATPTLRSLPALPGSRIAFFVNGEPQGIAFQDIYDYLPLRQTETQKANSRKRTREGVKEHRENPFDDGTLGYYPFISLFNDASVRLNPGPDFDFPPPDDIDAVLDDLASPNAKNTVLIPTPGSPRSSLLDLSITKEQDVKPEIDPASKEPISASALSPSSQHAPLKRTWRPACERYPEFMQEEWAFDALEEEDAKVELAKYAAAEKAEEEKRKQREKKRQQAEARRKAKKEAALAQQVVDAAVIEEEKERGRAAERERYSSLPLSGVFPLPGTLYGPGGHFPAHPSPSPLRHFTAFEPEGSVEYENSPAPTYISFSEHLGGQSGYTSENHEQEPVDHDLDDLDVDQDIEALMGSRSRSRTPA